MNRIGIARRFRAACLIVVACGLLLPLGSCVAGDITGGFLSQRNPARVVKVDTGAAAAAISRYRAENGLGPVRPSSRLNALAERQARDMAAADRMSHTVNGAFRSRIDGSGVLVRTAGENIAAGYEEFEDVFAGWRRSPPHRRNLLLREATEIGIGKAYAPGSRYKVFWTLILAAPDR